VNKLASVLRSSTMAVYLFGMSNLAKVYNCVISLDRPVLGPHIVSPVRRPGLPVVMHACFPICRTARATYVPLTSPIEIVCLLPAYSLAAY
jgi:hypothetical protein